MTAVHLVLPGGRQVHVGDLRLEVTATGALAAARFEYESTYLADPQAYAIGPDLPLGGGRFTSARLFGPFADAQPDSWGRMLLWRAALERGAAATVTEEDYLLQVHDDTRLGALRFHAHGHFQAPAHEGLPTLVDLDRLVTAADAVSRGAEIDDGMALLLAAGSSLGGARPKATVRRADGRLALAKFPALDDAWDVQRWELVTMRLAREARIRTPVAQLVERGGHRHSVLVMDRFDRAEDGTRIGYVSAATLLEHPFGSGPGPDYRTFAEDLAGSSADPERDAHELFRRVAFTLLVQNTDDHLRNHGMVRAAAGWRLSPAFDVNPQRLTAPSLSPTPLTPDDAGGADRDVRLLLDSAGSYRLTRDAAVQILTEVERATSGWVRAARAHGVAEDEIAPWARAFDNPNRQRVRDLPLLASAPAPSRGRRSPLRDGRGGLPPRDSRGRFVGAPPRDTGDTSARDDA